MGALERALRNHVTSRTPVLETPSSALAKHVTVYVLLAGILGGLVLVLLVFCCCKFCCRPSKQLTRQPVLFTKYPSDRHNNSGGRGSRKYHSLDPSVTIDLETSCGYSDNSTSPRELNEKAVPEAQVCLVQPPPPSIGDSALFLAEDGAHGSKGLHLPLNHSRSLDEVVSSPVSCRRSPSPFQRQSSFCVESDERLDQVPSSTPHLDSPSLPNSDTLPFLTQVAAEVHPTPSESDTEDKDDPLVAVGGPSRSSSARPVRELDDDDEQEKRRREANKSLVPRTWELDGGCSTSSPYKAYFQLPRPISPLAIVPEDEAWEEEEDERERREGGLQRTASTESGALETMMEERRRLLIRQDGTQLSDGDDDDDDSEPRAKVRYNDTGSLEEVDEAALDHFAAEQLLGESVVVDRYESAHQREQYRKLWKLRATLEETVEDDDNDDDEDDDGGGGGGGGEEEEEDETGCVQIQSSSSEPMLQADDVTSPEHSPEQIENHLSNINEKKEEGGGVGVGGVGVDEGHHKEVQEISALKPDASTTTTELQERRESYKSILSQRLQRKRPPGGGPTPHSSADDSFDSLETEGEGSSTDASRVEVATSFESTTDNTDSPGEGQGSRLQQMKADSGYKSLETNGKPPKLSRKQIHFVLDDDAIDVMEAAERDEGVSVEFDASVDDDEKPEEEEEAAPSDEGKETKLEGGGSSKATSSVFTRFFRTSRERQHHPRIFSRDYSIDEKSDMLFREFSRIDPAYEVDGASKRSPRLHSRHRLHARHSLDTPAAVPPTDSPRSRRKLAQQDNIEDEIRLERGRPPDHPPLALLEGGIPVIQVGDEETV